MRFTRISQVSAVATISALVLSACGSGANTSAGSGSGDPSGIVTAYSNEPQKPLLPSQTTEVFGGRVVEQIYVGLYRYNKEGQKENALAESMEAGSDNRTYTFKIKTGTRFTNGELVTAKSFVDSWNFAALSTNNQPNASFFSAIEGYDEVSATEGTGADAKPAPKAQTMSGLSAPDDATLVVKLKEPDFEWPQSLGYITFAPLPSEALKDPEKYGKNPVGNGPYKMKSADAWQKDKSISLVKNPDYSGPGEAKNGGLTFTFYTSPEAAYTDIQGDTLDVTDVIPSNALKTYESDLPDRTLNEPSASTNNLSFPEYLEEFQGEAGKLYKKAISMAIDREEVSSKIMNNTWKPLKGFVPPTIPGYSEDFPGSEVFTYNPEKAKELLQQAKELSPSIGTKPLTIAYNTDGGNKEWVDAIANQITNTLGVQAEGKPYAKFAALLDDRAQQKLTGMTRSGWQLDFPSPFNPLDSLFTSNGSGNYEKYASKKFDELVEEGHRSSDEKTREAKAREAQQVAAEDMPATSLATRYVQGGWSSKMQPGTVKADWRGQLIYSDMVKQG